MLTELPYTLPELYRGPTEWYVRFNYKSPITGKYETFKESYGLNKKRNFDRREIIAEEIIDYITKKLKKGFNPFEKGQPLSPVQELQKIVMNLGEAESDNLFAQHILNFITSQTEVNNAIICPESEMTEEELQELHKTSALTRIQEFLNEWNKTASKSQKHTYRTMQNRFTKFLQHINRLRIQIEEVDLDIGKGFRDYLKSVEKNKPKTVNTSISHLGLFWDELIERKYTKENPFRNVKQVTEKDYKGIDIDFDSEDDDFIPLTHDELVAVFAHFQNYCPHNTRFFGMIFWEFVRPIEITRIRVKDIDLKSGLIRISKGDAKNKNASYIQILSPMRAILEEMELHKYPLDYYVFTGEHYLPGTKQLNSEYARDVWNEIVKDGLGIDKKPYALKHSGNIQFIINNKGNVDREWMQRQNRHKTRSQTDKYIERLNIYVIDESQYNFLQLPVATKKPE